MIMFMVMMLTLFVGFLQEKSRKWKLKDFFGLSLSLFGDEHIIANMACAQNSDRKIEDKSCI